MPNKFEGGFPAKTEKPVHKPDQAAAEPKPAEQPKEEAKAAGNIEEAVMRHVAAQPETKPLTPRQQSLENEVKEINARLPELEAKRAQLADALRGGFGVDAETAKPRNWLFGMFDNFNEILKEYKEVEEDIRINRENLQDAGLELRDPQKYAERAAVRFDSAMKRAGRAAGRDSNRPKGMLTGKG